jgi:prepilin-type N-terminal cleavage/methylation domain-containing protein
MVAFRFELPPASRSAADRGRKSVRSAFTLVEMLVAMAITLVMMAAVVTLFANVSNSVRNRRATVEMTNQLRHMRNTLQQDLQGATCPGATWQRPESNHGYIELIEGIHNDQNPTGLIRDLNNDGVLDLNESQLDPQQSTIPRNNVALDGADTSPPNGEISAKEIEQYYRMVRSFVPGGLGDHDDVLMLTVRNEQQPFVGRVPTNIRDGNEGLPFNVSNAVVGWDDNSTVESPLAEVMWFCVENPATQSGQDPERFFGEAGIRTIYRRTFLIAPWLNPYSRLDTNTGREIPFTYDGGTFTAEPGLVRILPSSVEFENVIEAIAAIIAFQDRYDLSVRLEWDHNIERWKIMANTLADLTKRENRFNHFGFVPSDPPRRDFPYAFISTGSGYSGNKIDLEFMTDVEAQPSGGSAQWQADIGQQAGVDEGTVVSYSLKNTPPAFNDGFLVRPFVFVEEEPDDGGYPAVANATLDEQGNVMRVTLGPAPLWGTRRGQDVMMTEVLGFDVRVFDPGAPLYGRRDIPGEIDSPLTVLQPSDPGWRLAYDDDLGFAFNEFEFMGQGAYADMGYTYGKPPMKPVPTNKSWTYPWFAQPRGLSDVYGNLMAPGYSVYDTWSFNYENNGVNEDADGDVDEGTDGFDDPDFRTNAPFNAHDPGDVVINGADDVGERETIPPYDKPLRGVQVLVRTYEVDSRAIRQVRVNQHFLPE